MKSRDVVRRLAAFGEGRPLESGATMHTCVSDPEDILILAFVRMGGESLPWGVAVGRPGQEPEIRCVPEPRDRDQVAAMLAELTAVVGRHLQHPEMDPAFPAGELKAEDIPLRQVWVPNPSHLGMLHLLNLRYTLARRGPEDRIPILNALGRMAGWLFRDSQIPGQQNVLDASATLRESFVFPSDDLRQQHLGYLLALLSTHGDFETREAAGRDAERGSVSTSLDPSLEREALEPLLEDFAAARGKGAKAAAEVASRITAVIVPELQRRAKLVEQAIAFLRSDKRPINPGTEKLARESKKSRIIEYLSKEAKLAAGEWAWIDSPVTDKPTAAAAGFFRLEGAHERFSAALLHHDREMQDEAIGVGDAFRGLIVEVRDEGAGRKTVPVWVIDAPGEGPLRLRERSRVTVAGLSSRTGVIRAVEGPTGGSRRFTVQISGLTTRPRGPAGRNVPLANDAGLVGAEVTMLSGGGAGFGAAKASRVWDKNVPGGWLTHDAGAAPVATTGKGRGDVAAEVDELRAV